jgi:hypothetical protein
VKVSAPPLADGCLDRIVFCVFGEDAQRAFDRALSG